MHHFNNYYIVVFHPSLYCKNIFQSYLLSKCSKHLIEAAVAKLKHWHIKAAISLQLFSNTKNVSHLPCLLLIQLYWQKYFPCTCLHIISISLKTLSHHHTIIMIVLHYLFKYLLKFTYCHINKSSNLSCCYTEFFFTDKFNNKKSLWLIAGENFQQLWGTS